MNQNARWNGEIWKIRLFLSLSGIELWFLDFDNFSKAIFVVTQIGENQYFPGKTQYLLHVAENFNNHLVKMIKTVDIWIVIFIQGTRHTDSSLAD
jgi:hypothetical protein